MVPVMSQSDASSKQLDAQSGPSTVRTGRLDQLFHMLFQAHPWHGVSCQTDTDAMHRAFIEIAAGDTIKYELDKPTGILRVDRPQRFSNLCPALYGFFPQTYCDRLVAERCRARVPALAQAEIVGDGDPLDVCVLSERPISQSNFLMNVRIVGGLRMIDGGEVDDKIIAVAEGDAVYGAYEDLPDIAPALVLRLKHYFLTYKAKPPKNAKMPPVATTDQMLERAGGASAAIESLEKKVYIAEEYGREEAHEVLRRSMLDYATSYGEPDARMREFLQLLGR
jgi:inorganic pyrophosphatase